MKKIAIIAVGCLLTLNFAFAGEPTAADKQWLVAVEKMVAKGQTKVSTPSQERVDLLKEWAGKNGYSVEVTKNDSGYRAQLSQRLAKN